MAEVERAISKFEPFSLICKHLFVLFAGMREIGKSYYSALSGAAGVLIWLLTQLYGYAPL